MTLRLTRLGPLVGVVEPPGLPFIKMRDETDEAGDADEDDCCCCCWLAEVSIAEFRLGTRTLEEAEIDAGNVW